MANPPCPSCGAARTVKHGSFYRRDDAQTIQRFLCRGCQHSFSRATLSDTYRQKRRRINASIQTLLCCGVSQRRIARVLSCCPRTVARRIGFLAARARAAQALWLAAQRPFERVQFDELITFEHSRLKPLSVAVMVAWPARKILGIAVADKPASGPIAEKSREKYGPRPDRSPAMREALFKDMAPYLAEEDLLIETDRWLDYAEEIARAYPQAEHRQFTAERGALTGQGELKRVGFDPLFGIDHTLAMLRDNIKRLTRRTWCTTKKQAVLDDILAIYIRFHNEILTVKPARC